MIKFFRAFHGFGRAREGLAALEFAILAPMMVFLLFASVDLIDMLGANKRSQNVAASLADVIARDTEVSNAEIAGIWEALDIIMYPNDATSMQARITSVSINQSNQARVVWSEGHGGMAPRPVNATVSLPAAMMQPGSSVIMAETSYQYNSPLGFLAMGGVNMRHDAYRRSRLVDPIPRVS